MAERGPNENIAIRQPQMTIASGIVGEDRLIVMGTDLVAGGEHGFYASATIPGNRIICVITSSQLMARQCSALIISRF
jgi:hypothetical protein